jgi:hypothetical protein
MTPAVERQLAEFRALSNIESATVVHDGGCAILVVVVPIAPTAAAAGDWAQPSEPFLMGISDRSTH